jgi:hypothetical protein
MTETLTRATAAHAAVPTDPARTRPRAAPTTPLGLLWWALGSMQLTVVLLVLLALLTWLGTLAQVQDGIYYVQKQYFESWYVVPKLGLLPLPLPGAVPVMGLLFANLLVGGIARLRWSPRNAGILVTHFGIALLLLAGYVKLQMSFAGHMSLRESTTGSAIRSMHEWELALYQQDGDTVTERTVPGAVLERAVDGTPLRLPSEGLPFAIEITHFREHCIPVRKGPMLTANTPVVDGAFLFDDREQLPGAKEREQKLAGCYATVVPLAGAADPAAPRQQGILWANDMQPRNVGAPHRPWRFTVAGKTYGLELRHQLWNLPFDLRLDRFQKSEHPGTTMARDYSSFVTVMEQSGQSRAAHIYMNEPLRKDGFVAYQTSFGPDPERPGSFYSTFEVANNPSDKWPEYACYVIGVGLLWHFVAKLLRYIAAENRRRTELARAEGIA